MPVIPVPHSTWQVLRAVKRSRKPATGRELRLSPTPRTRTGTFLTDLVHLGLLERATGTEAEPFEATYKLTALGDYAAEHGECDVPIEALRAARPAVKPAKKAARKTAASKRSR